MRAVVQRASSASVLVEAREVASIGEGLVVLVGVGDGDDAADVAALASKLSGLRIFRDGDGRMNLAITEAGGEVLLVSQFTLLADVRRGRRPSFTKAAAPAAAEPLVDMLAEDLRSRGIGVATGVFGAMMEVRLVNDGPVTIVIDVEDGVVR